jgi:hypothetical protein
MRQEFDCRSWVTSYPPYGASVGCVIHCARFRSKFWWGTGYVENGTFVGCVIHYARFRSKFWWGTGYVQYGIPGMCYKLTT